MAKEEFKAIITDKKQIELLQKEFAEKRDKIHQKIYTSMTEERLRTNKIHIAHSIDAPIEDVFIAVATKAAQDMHPLMKYDDLKVNTFYRSSGRGGKIPFKIIEFVENEVITIEYFASGQQFIKTLKFYANKNNTKTKINYIDVVTGMVSILGWYEKHIRNVYIKRMTIAFKIQILSAQLDLGLIPEKNVNKAKFRIEKMIDYSKNLF